MSCNHIDVSSTHSSHQCVVYIDAYRHTYRHVSKSPELDIEATHGILKIIFVDIKSDAYEMPTVSYLSEEKAILKAFSNNFTF